MLSFEHWWVSLQGFCCCFFLSVFIIAVQKAQKKVCFCSCFSATIKHYRKYHWAVSSPNEGMNYSQDTGRSQKHALVSSSCKHKQRKAPSGVSTKTVSTVTHLWPQTVKPSVKHTALQRVFLISVVDKDFLTSVVTLLIEDTVYLKRAGLIQFHSSFSFIPKHNTYMLQLSTFYKQNGIRFITSLMPFQLYYYSMWKNYFYLETTIRFGSFQTKPYLV